MMGCGFLHGVMYYMLMRYIVEASMLDVSMQIKCILIVILSTLAVACDNNPKAEVGKTEMAHVDVVSLQSQPVTISSKLPGRTVSVRTAEVRPQVDGIILKRLFKEGSEVRAGEQLYQIDPSIYQATFNKAKATKINAELLAKRYKTLSQVHAVSIQDFDDAVSKAEQAKADLDSARINLEYTKVKAPVTGRIDRSLVTEGALVTSGQSSYLTTITQLDPMYVDISESSRNLLHLRRMLSNGQIESNNNHDAPVQLVMEDGTIYPLKGRLEFSEVRVDEGTGSVTLRATFPNPEHVLLPGMFVHAVLQQGIKNGGILVPQESVGHDSKGRPFVYVVSPEKIIEQRSVTTGEFNDGKWLVTDGLRTGEQVVVKGIQKINPGDKVVASEWNPTPVINEKISLSMNDPSAQ